MVLKIKIGGNKMGYEFKKTVWKFAKTGIYVFIAGLASVYGGNSWYLAIAPLLHSFENWLKHRNK